MASFGWAIEGIRLKILNIGYQDSIGSENPYQISNIGQYVRILIKY